MTIKFLVPAAATAVLLGALPATAAPVDLSTWAVAGPGTWVLAPDNNSVRQTVNGNPTIFFSDFNGQGRALSGTISVAANTGDDDFIGFVLGYDPGEIGSASADYLLIDWKANDQGSFGCTAERGFAISRVSGPLGNNAGAWCHSPTGNVTELQRGATLFDTGWVATQVYDFDLEFGADRVRVFVDGVLELDVAGAFGNGRFGFYNYSQALVTYGAIEDVILPPPPPPVDTPAPAGIALLGLGAAFIARRASKV